MSLSFFIKPPRSGGSIYANKWVQEAPGRVIVCADDLRLALTGQRWCAPIEDYVHAVKHTMIKAHLSRGFDLIIDGTHTTWSSIRKLLEIDPEAQPLWVTELFGVPRDHLLHPHFQSYLITVCNERAFKTDQKDLIPVIERMVNQIVVLAEDFDTKFAALRDEVRKQYVH